MPSVSKAQHNFFEMLKHNPKLAKEKGIPKKTVNDYLEADKHQNLSKLPEHSGDKKKKK